MSLFAKIQICDMELARKDDVGLCYTVTMKQGHIILERKWYGKGINLSVIGNKIGTGL